MSGEPDFLDANRIRQETFVGYVELHDTLSSTNDRALELVCEEELQMPALVAARVQTAGRGRDDHRWWADDGALTFSLLVDSVQLDLAQSQWAQLSLTTAVAVCDALHQEIPEAIVGLKWPNDVLVDGGKICGILIESPSGASRLVIGIGINVNNSWHDAPHEAGPDGVALCDISGRRHDLQSLLISVLQALDRRIAQLSAAPVELARDWQDLCLLTGERVSVDAPQKHVEGECLGISEDGALLIETGWDVQSLLSGTVTVLV